LATDVITLQQNLMTSAHAHHPVAQIVEARRRVARAEKEQKGRNQQSRLQASLDG
jgi:hypothetical protein